MATFLSLPLGLFCSQMRILTSYCFYSTQWLRVGCSKGSTRLGASLPENGMASKLLCLFKKLDDGQSPKKEDFAS